MTDCTNCSYTVTTPSAGDSKRGRPHRRVTSEVVPTSIEGLYCHSTVIGAGGRPPPYLQDVQVPLSKFGGLEYAGQCLNTYNIHLTSNVYRSYSYTSTVYPLEAVDTVNSILAVVGIRKLRQPYLIDKVWTDLSIPSIRKIRTTFYTDLVGTDTTNTTLTVSQIQKISTTKYSSISTVDVVDSELKVNRIRVVRVSSYTTYNIPPHEVNTQLGVLNIHKRRV